MGDIYGFCGACTSEAGWKTHNARFISSDAAPPAPKAALCASMQKIKGNTNLFFANCCLMTPLYSHRCNRWPWRGVYPPITTVR